MNRKVASIERCELFGTVRDRITMNRLFGCLIIFDRNGKVCQHHNGTASELLIEAI